MLTNRGWWLLIVTLALLALARFGAVIPEIQSSGVLAPPNGPLGVLGLALGLWFAWEWTNFVLRARRLARRLRVTRELRDAHGPVDALWVRKSFEVQTVLTLPGRLSLPFVRVTDRLPYAAEHVSGENQYEGPLAAGEPLRFRYQLRCAEVGRVRFEGIRVQVSDYHGFFYAVHFLRRPAEYRVLPPLADAEGHMPSVKRHNLLPPPGVHRLRRPGSGSELLDLRDYLPGDPPKTIAWKASARRDRLITKEFESEVPVRCTLFVDTSQAVRVGRPGKTALNKLVEIAAAVAQAAAAARDLTGLCLFDERHASYVRPARGSRHLAGLMNRLVDAAGLMPAAAEAEIETLLPPAYRLAREVYPDLLRPEINHLPAWLPWLRPQRPDTLRKPRWADRFNVWLPLLVAAYAVAGSLIVWYSAVMLRRYLFPRERHLAGPQGAIVLFSLVILGLIFVLTVALAALPTFVFPERRRAYRRRKLLSALLAQRYGPSPGGVAVLMEDEEFFVLRLQRFLAEHRVPYAPALADSLDRAAFTSPRKVSVLADALLRAVSKGHDNELYVLMVDLLAAPDQLDPLLRAVRVAVARHHRVMVICPWPPDVPPPSSAGAHGADGVTARLEAAFQQVRRTFARLGVPVICAEGGDPPRLILDRLDRLRMLGRRR